MRNCKIFCNFAAKKEMYTAAQIPQRQRPMSRKELAIAYAPELTVNGAYRRLRTWMSMSRHLMRALRRVGYQPGQRMLTGLQVQTIYQFLGEP